MAKKTEIMRVELAYLPVKSASEGKDLLDRVAEAESRLKAIKEDVKKKMAELVPLGETVEGVSAVQITRKSVSWKEVAEETKRRLVPKTRWPEAEAIVELKTSVSEWIEYKRKGAS